MFVLTVTVLAKLRTFEELTHIFGVCTVYISVALFKEKAKNSSFNKLLSD
jgi:hypothetical protein